MTTIKYISYIKKTLKNTLKNLKSLRNNSS